MVGVTLQNSDYEYYSYDYRRLKGAGENFIVLKNPLNNNKFPLRFGYGADDVLDVYKRQIFSTSIGGLTSTYSIYQQ